MAKHVRKKVKGLGPILKAFPKGERKAIIDMVRRIAEDPTIGEPVNELLPNIMHCPCGGALVEESQFTDPRDGVVRAVLDCSTCGKTFVRPIIQV